MKLLKAFLVLLAAGALHAEIARTWIGSVTSKTCGSPIITNIHPIDTTDTLVVVTATDYNPGMVVSYRWDGSPSSHQSMSLAVSATNTDNVVTQIFVLDTPTTASNSSATIVVGAFSNNACAAVALKITGVQDPSSDVSSAGTGSSSSPSSGATSTTSQGYEILIGGVGTEGPGDDTAGTWNNSFNDGQRTGTTGGGPTSNVTISEGWRIVTSTGAYTASKSGITSRDWAAAILTLKGSGDPPAPSPSNLTLLGVGEE